VPEPESAAARIRRIAGTLEARPLRNARVASATLNEIEAGSAGAEDKLARVAVEIYLRRNRCYTGTDAADARFSTAEQRAIRSCASLQTARLMKDRTQPDPTRALEWLEETLAP